MAFPIYDFSNSLLDYSSVETTAKEMYSYILYSGNNACCKPKPVQDTLNQAVIFLQALEIDKAANDIVRYDSDCKTAYLLLYPLT